MKHKLMVHILSSAYLQYIPVCNISWPTVRIESYLVAIAEFRFHFHLNHASLLRDVTNKAFVNAFRFKLTLFSTWPYN